MPRSPPVRRRSILRTTRCALIFHTRSNSGHSQTNSDMGTVERTGITNAYAVAYKLWWTNLTQDLVSVTDSVLPGTESRRVKIGPQANP